MLTHNLLCTFQIDQMKSGYKHLNSHKYDWNTQSLTPSGTRPVIYIDSVTIISWGPGRLGTWYNRPATDHCRCLHAFVPGADLMRISGSYHLFRKYCIMPTFKHKQRATAVNNDLKVAILGLDNKANKSPLKAMAK